MLINFFDSTPLLIELYSEFVEYLIPPYICVIIRDNGVYYIHIRMIVDKLVRSTSRINSLYHSCIPTPFGRQTHAGIALLLSEVGARWGISLRLVYMKVEGLRLLRFTTTAKYIVLFML